jgi:hypothetical protein
LVGTDSLDNVYHLTSEKKKLDIRLPLTLCIEDAHQSSKTVLVNATKSIFVFVSDIQNRLIALDERSGNIKSIDSNILIHA